MKCVFILLAVVIGKCWGHCLHTRPDYYQQRRFYHHGLRLPIVLEGSNRLSHMIANQILRILLQEVIGYMDVKMFNEDSMNATGILDRITGCPVERCDEISIDSIPETMVNIETWMVAGFDKSPWISTIRLEDCGPLGPYGRMGWFMPTTVVDEFWKSGIIVDHWKALKKPHVAKRFSWSVNLTSLAVCVEVDCISRMFRPVICQNTTTPCATLFSSYYDLDTGVLKEQIINLELPVEIVWLGNLLPKFIQEQTQKKNPVLFFDWYPNALTASHNYTRLKLPMCSGDPEQLPYTCDFDVHQFSKVVWHKIKINAPEAYHVISKMTFRQEEYESLLHKFNILENKTDEDIACDWILNHKNIWKQWLPPDLSNKTTIYIGGLFPLSGPYLEQPGLVEGALLVLDYDELSWLTPRSNLK